MVRGEASVGLGVGVCIVGDSGEDMVNPYIVCGNCMGVSL